MEYSDLDLNKMIAELEGLKPVIVADMVKTNGSINYAPIEHDANIGTNQHNKNINILYRLMVKYKVGIAYALKDSDSSVGICEIKDNRYDTVFKSESEIPRAIIMCILKSKNII